MVSPADSSEQNHQFVCLKCKRNSTDKQTMLVNFLNNETFCDVALVCEEKLIFAHKVIIAMCSSYFQNILTKFEKRDPIVILKDIKHSIMISLIDFMYKGELIVQQGQVVEILEAAQVLKINGLLEGDDYDISKCELPTGTNMSETENVNERDVCLNVCKMKQQTSFKTRKLAELRRKHIRNPSLKRRCLVKNTTDDNDSSADSTEELLKEAESIFQELNEVRDKNKGPALPNGEILSPNKKCVQGADKNLAPIFLKDKSNFMSGQLPDLNEDCQEYDSTTSNNKKSTVDSLVGSEDCHAEENESHAMYNENANTTSTVNITRTNLGSDKENEGNTTTYKEQSIADRVVCVVLVSEDPNDKELSTVTDVNDIMLHMAKDFEESINVNIITTNSKNETSGDIDDSIPVLHNGENNKPNESNADHMNDQSTVHHSLDDSQGNDIGVVNDTNTSMVSEDKSILINIESTQLSQVPARRYKPFQNPKRKLKKKPLFGRPNVDLKLSGEQSANSNIPCGRSALEIDSSHVDESCDKHKENLQLRRSSRRKISKCDISESVRESGREQNHPNYFEGNQLTSESEGEGFHKGEKIDASTSNKSVSKSGNKQADSSGGGKTTHNINQMMSEPGSSKNPRPIRKKIENRKMAKSKTTLSRQTPRNKQTIMPTESRKRMALQRASLNEGVIPMTEYLSKPGNSEQLFWKEPWSVLIVKAVSHKKLGKLNGATMLGVDYEALNEQICLRKKTLNLTKPKQIKRRRKSKVQSESTDYDSDQDTETLSIKDYRSKKNIKRARAVDRKSESAASDMDEEDSDFCDNSYKKPLPLVDKTNHASIEPTLLTCTLNLEPVPVLQSTASEYSDDDDDSEEFSETSEAADEDLKLNMIMSTESRKRMALQGASLNEGVIPMIDYLSKPGNSEQLFWKEPWSVLIVKAVSNKKLGKLNGATMLGVDCEALNEQICLRKKTLNLTLAKQITRRQKSKVPSESTDYDSDQDSGTLSIKDDRSKKNIKRAVDRKSDSATQILCSDMGEEDSDFWDNKYKKPLPLVDKTNNASIEPTPLACNLNLEPVPVLQSTASEYSNVDDVSEEFSETSEVTDDS